MSQEQPTPRLAVTAAAVAATLALIGFVTGTDDRRPTRSVVDPAFTKTGSEAVPSFAMLGERRRGANADVNDGVFKALREGLPRLTDEVERSGDRKTVLAARAKRRAYDGAPPTIPHAIDERGYPACLACHEHGAKVGDLIAPAMSHQALSSCTQCHVPTANPIDLGEIVVDNRFVGVASPGTGQRAWKGAPPTIPHPTAMRERCSSCHGVSGASPIRATHPWRQSCQQCHVPSVGNGERSGFPIARGNP